MIIWDPFFALAEQPGVQVLADATGLANNREYILVHPDAVTGRAAQIRTFLDTYQKTTTWGIANPDERAEVLAPELKIDRAVTARALSRAAQPLAPLTPEVGDELQRIADGFTELKLIPGKVDMKARVAGRFTAPAGHPRRGRGPAGPTGPWSSTAAASPTNWPSDWPTPGPRTTPASAPSAATSWTAWGCH